MLHVMGMFKKAAVCQFVTKQVVHEEITTSFATSEKLLVSLMFDQRFVFQAKLYACVLPTSINIHVL